MGKEIIDVPEMEMENEVSVASDEAKARKKEAAERFKARKAEEAQKRVEAATRLKEILEKNKLWDKLDADVSAFIDGCIQNKQSRTASNNNIFNTLFGATPKVGDSITLMKAFELTTKGKATIDVYVRKWKEKGIVVEFVQDAANLLNSTYVIKAM